MAMKGKPVSKELNKVLNHITGLGKAKRKVRPIVDTADWYQCAWYDGCYYCQRVEHGRWQLMYRVT